MRAVVQRVSRAAVHVDGDLVSEIGHGMLVLLGVHEDDAEKEAVHVADKLAALRIFADESGQMNRAITDARGEVMVVSQFTLFGDTRKGRRPSFIRAATPDIAEPLIDLVVERLRAAGIATCTGVFGAHMDVELTNDGPVTLIIDTVT